MTTEKRPVGRPRTRNVKGFPADYVGFRAPRELKEQLEEAAAQNGRSLSTEAQFRLNQSFAEEIAYGGAELRRMVYRMSVAFGHSGATHAASLGHTDRAPDDWIKDPEVYRSAMAGAVAALALAYPGGMSPDDWLYVNEWVRGRMANREFNHEPFARGVSS
jgi:hypothetical protein